MNFQIDHHDVVSILADVRRRGRLLETALRDDLPALLGHRLPSGLPRVADAARDGHLIRGYGRDMLPVVIAACDRAIEDGVSTKVDWHEAAYIDGAVEMACREIEVMTEAALSLLPIRRDLREIVDLLERVDDLIAAQRALGDMRL
ncbi:MAG: hypothetical protein ABTQ27_09510 [Amaricoccus sp.]|uniref:hypothetical protein n=1 Tax=Amaricoccus sp. TaxID=1872485 RepID=UPI003315ECA1